MVEVAEEEEEEKVQQQQQQQQESAHAENVSEAQTVAARTDGADSDSGAGGTALSKAVKLTTANAAAIVEGAVAAKPGAGGAGAVVDGLRWHRPRQRIVPVPPLATGSEQSLALA